MGEEKKKKMKTREGEEKIGDVEWRRGKEKEDGDERAKNRGGERSSDNQFDRI